MQITPGFRPDMMEPGTMQERCDLSSRRILLPRLNLGALGGRASVDGGPWIGFSILTEPSVFDVGPVGPGPLHGELRAIVDDDSSVYPRTGTMVRTGRPFKRLTFVDQRTVSFIPIDLRLLLFADPDFFMFCQSWL